MTNLRYIYLQGNEILSFDIRYLKSLFNAMVVETDFPGMCCFQASAMNCVEIGSAVKCCIGKKLLFLWYLYIPLTLFFNILVVLTRLQRSYNDVISLIILHSSLAELAQVLSLIFRIYLNSQSNQFAHFESSFASKLCKASAFFFLLSYFVHVIFSFSFAVGYFCVTSYFNLFPSASKGHKLCVLVWMVCLALSWTVFYFSKLIPNLCLPLNSSGNIYPIIVYITTTIVITLTSNIIMLIAMRKSDVKRINVDRQETKEEKLLKIRYIFEISTSSLCYIIPGIIMLYISTTTHVQQDLIVAIDSLLLCKTIFDSIMLTFATKSFRKRVVQKWRSRTQSEFTSSVYFYLEKLPAVDLTVSSMDPTANTQSKSYTSAVL